MSQLAPRIALATCTALPDQECDDDFLRSALRARGLHCQDLAWNDPEVDWTRFDACLVRTTWDYTEHLNEFSAWIERTATQTQLLNSPALMLPNLSKRYLQTLANAGVATVPTQWLEAGEVHDLDGIMHRLGWSKAMIKPAVGIGSEKTHPFENSSTSIAAAQQHLDAFSAQHTFLLQPFLESVSTRGELSLIYFDHEFSHAVQKVPAAGDYRVQDDFGAQDFPIDPPAEALKIAEFLLATLPELALYARVDFLFDDQGSPLVNEFEQIEPSLFFRHDRKAADRLVIALLKRL